MNTRTTNKNQTAETIWLLYYNQILFERGIISESERNRMKNKIESRTSPTKQGK